MANLIDCFYVFGLSRREVGRPGGEERGESPFCGSPSIEKKYSLGSRKRTQRLEYDSPADPPRFLKKTYQKTINSYILGQTDVA